MKFRIITNFVRSCIFLFLSPLSAYLYNDEKKTASNSLPATATKTQETSYYNKFSIISSISFPFFSLFSNKIVLATMADKISRKRKIDLNLSLSYQPITDSYEPTPEDPPAAVVVTRAASRPRHNPSQSPREGKPITICPKYRWATDKRATVHSLSYLLSEKITAITGDVVCKRCERVRLGGQVCSGGELCS